MNAIIKQMTVGMRVGVIKATGRYGTPLPQIEIKSPKASRDGYHAMAAAAYAVASQVHLAMAGKPEANFAVTVEVLSANSAYVGLELVKDDEVSVDKAVAFLGRVIA